MIRSNDPYSGSTNRYGDRYGARPTALRMQRSAADWR